MDYREPTSGAGIILPEEWEVSVAATPYAPIVASLPLADGSTMSTVITAELPPAQFQELALYVKEQLRLFTVHEYIHSARVLGYRESSVGVTPAILTSCMFIQNDTELCNYQLYTLRDQVASVLTVTAPLALLTDAYFVAQELSAVYTPATSNYSYPGT